MHRGIPAPARIGVVVVAARHRRIVAAALEGQRLERLDLLDSDPDRPR